MEFRTIVDIPKPGFQIGPCEEMLFVGSCFSSEIGRRFQEEKFRTEINPYGVMLIRAEQKNNLCSITVY